MKDEIVVFISYSWEDEQHNRKVEQFVNRLRESNIYVLYDRDMPLGERITDFMEMINRSEYVLFLCTPKYKEKADIGLGGVKYEKNIITAELYEKGNERKFIPILFSSTWQEALPIWAKGKLGVDYTKESDKEFDKLINHLKANTLKGYNGIKESIYHIPVAKIYIKRNYIFLIFVLCIIFAIIYIIRNDKLDYVSKSSHINSSMESRGNNYSSIQENEDSLKLEDYEYNPSELISVLDENLRKLLGDKYKYFIDCFDTIGETYLYEDGIFINGYVRGIVPYMSGVLCVDTDGYIYVLLIEPEENIIYYTDNPEKSSSLPLTKFDGIISYWLENYNTYHVSFESASDNNGSIEGVYVRENAKVEVKVNNNNTITISGFASSGANMGEIDCSIDYENYADGAYAKYVTESDADQYFVFYFGGNSLTILDRAPYWSGMGVSFEGEYFKYKSDVD